MCTKKEAMRSPELKNPVNKREGKLTILFITMTNLAQLLRHFPMNMKRIGKIKIIGKCQLSQTLIWWFLYFIENVTHQSKVMTLLTPSPRLFFCRVYHKSIQDKAKLQKEKIINWLVCGRATRIHTEGT